MNCLFSLWKMALCFLMITSVSSSLFSADKHSSSWVEQIYNQLLVEAEKSGDSERVAVLKQMVDSQRENASLSKQDLSKNKKNNWFIKSFFLVGVGLPLAIVAWRIAYLFVKNPLGDEVDALRADVRALFVAVDGRLDRIGPAMDTRIAQVNNTVVTQTRTIAESLRAVGQEMGKTRQGIQWATGVATAVGIFLFLSQYFH